MKVKAFPGREGKRDAQQMMWPWPQSQASQAIARQLGLARFLSTCRGFGDPSFKQPDPIARSDLSQRPRVR